MKYPPSNPPRSGRRTGFLREEQGATAVEYALMICLIAVLVAIGIGALGSSTKAPLHRVADAINGAAGGGTAAAAAGSETAAGAAGGSGSDAAKSAPGQGGASDEKGSAGDAGGSDGSESGGPPNGGWDDDAKGGSVGTPPG